MKFYSTYYRTYFWKPIRPDVVGTSLQQNDFIKEIHKDKVYETIDNKYEDLSIEMPKTQTL